ncbi:MAG: hypothetical protein ACYTG0_02190 [Planctomycetota bacterium]
MRDRNVDPRWETRRVGLSKMKRVGWVEPVEPAGRRPTRGKTSNQRVGLAPLDLPYTSPLFRAVGKPSLAPGQQH